MRNQLRAHYLSLARTASEKSEPSPETTSPFPPDLPDWAGPDYDWPDAPAPDPRVNDANRHFAWGWLTTCAVVTLGSLTYLIWQAL